MKGSTRDVLRRLGSTKMSDLGWRDMWTMVTMKGGRLYGEQLSKSSDFNSWGAPVLLRVEVPLIPTQGDYLNFIFYSEFIILLLIIFDDFYEYKKCY